MTDADTEHRQQVALFRYGLIAEFVHLPPGEPGLYQRLEAKARLEYTIPGSTRTRVAAETLRDWLKLYRKGGFDALMPKPRTDRGRSRALSDEVAELLLSLKEANPKISVRALIREARACGKVPDTQRLTRTTVHRLLSVNGLMRPAPSTPSSNARRR